MKPPVPRGIVRRRGGQAYRDASIRTLGRPKEARFALRSLIASPRDNLMGNLRQFVDRSSRVMTDEERSYMTNEW